MNNRTLTPQEEHDLLTQARTTVNEVTNARNKARKALENLRPQLVDAIDNFLSDTEKEIQLAPALDIELWESKFGEEPAANIGTAEIGFARFDDESGQSVFAIDGEADEDGSPCYGYSTDNLNCYDLTELLARLLNAD